MDPFLMQKQIRDNANDLSSFLNELKSWEKEMKRKDEELLDTSDNSTVPPVRSKIKRSKNASPSDNSLGNTEVKRIPSNDYSSWDKFDVEKACEEIDNKEKESDLVDFESVSKPDVDSVDADVARLRERAMYEKDLGNQLVKKQRWKDAIGCYTKAIQCNPYDAAFYANRALCYLKTKDFRLAETDCTTALQLDPSYVKAYQRRALARVEIGLRDDAKSDFQKVLEFEPNNSAAKSELSKLEKLGQSSLIERKEAITKKVISKKRVEKSISPEQNIIEKKSFTTGTPGESAVSKRGLERVPDIPGAGGDTGSLEIPGSIFQEGDKDILPVQKPPHLRSKCCLKVIPIKEIETFADLLEHSGRTGKKNNNSGRKIVELNTKSSPKLGETKQINEPTVKIEKHVKEGPSRLQEFNKLPEQKPSSCNDICLPPIPRTSMQFIVSWKIVKNNRLLQYQFLKQIPGSEFPQIFQESLESREFGEIINLLATEFLKRNDPVYSYLRGLSEVKRFSALVMFMSKSEKAVIKKLLQHCDENSECSKEDFAELLKRYDIN